jgi:hypothetical protein
MPLSYLLKQLSYIKFENIKIIAYKYMRLPKITEFYTKYILSSIPT